MLKDKWKQFSANLHLSEYPKEYSPEQVYDLVVNAETNSKILDKLEIVVWHPFSNMPLFELQNNMEVTAYDAQRYSES